MTLKEATRNLIYIIEEVINREDDTLPPGNYSNEYIEEYMRKSVERSEHDLTNLKIAIAKCKEFL
jgi:hypothetical protein